MLEYIGIGELGKLRDTRENIANGTEKAQTVRSGGRQGEIQRTGPMRKDRAMKIVIITGSAHKNGTTAALAEQFMRGATDAGHEVVRFDAADKDIHPCIGCGKCHRPGASCVFQDDMSQLNPALLMADAIVFASPIYYYAMNAQIKTVIDRFYANDEVLHDEKKTVLLTAMADDTIESADGANASFRSMASFMEWEVAGILNAVACPDVQTLMQTDYPQQAYELGRSM